MIFEIFNMKYIYSIFFILIFYSLPYCQPQARMTYEAGKCYAKCLMQDQYEDKEFTIIEYTGHDYTNPYVIEITIVISEELLKWVKVKDANCLSNKPDDCLVWSMKTMPEISEDFYIVKDTNQLKDFKVNKILRKVIVKAGGFTEWREILCKNRLTPQMIRSIRSALAARGYLVDKDDGKINEDIKAALVEYQKLYNLPIGAFDLATLKSLGIEY